MNTAKHQTSHKYDILGIIKTHTHTHTYRERERERERERDIHALALQFRTDRTVDVNPVKKRGKNDIQACAYV